MIEEIRSFEIENLNTLFTCDYNVESFYLENDNHKIYYEISGNKKGIPVVFVHGGPGSPLGDKAKRFFNPKKYFIITIDQRGCGKSLPFGKLEDNNTFKLVEDMEKIRKILKISKWIVFGGSWGSTLSLVYAINHPEKVLKLVLRGIFLARKEDTDWLFKKGASYFYPKEFENYLEILNENERKDPIKSYSKYLNMEINVAKKYAKRWSDWEHYCLQINYSKPSLEITDIDVSKAKLENHYMINDCFLKDNYILENSYKLKNIDVYIVHGRYDIDCRIIGAYELYKALDKKANLYIIQDAGHSSFEKGITHQLIDIMENKINI